MSKQDPADQVKFLVSCIGHTSNGRPDFQAVADELDIVTKAAAQKRYERMLKAHNISRPGGAAAGGEGAKATDGVPSTPTKTPTKRKAKADGGGSAKKRTPKAKAKKESEDEEEAKPKKGKKEPLKKEEEAESGGSPLTEPPVSEEGSA
ncbi:hypothetical protein FZEAL_9871 [Fusarium zealandicum]|uniref:Myb-like DNA-binding domain-containing protein n=1 Tax=Fusarium zealandicum TaxID=1053134 RepID=A0A8H4XEN9_9HYPO|nr:hypothetical protein FZEAL_9871 [Fusarium zealandicum]